MFFESLWVAGQLKEFGRPLKCGMLSAPHETIDDAVEGRDGNPEKYSR